MLRRRLPTLALLAFAGCLPGFPEDFPLSLGAALIGNAGGTTVRVEGLGTNNSLTLQLNGANNLTVTGSGDFQFPVTLAEGAEYSITILSAPAAPFQACSVTNGSGQYSSSATPVVACQPGLTSVYPANRNALPSDTPLTLRFTGALQPGSCQVRTVATPESMHASAGALTYSGDTLTLAPIVSGWAPAGGLNIPAEPLRTLFLDSCTDQSGRALTGASISLEYVILDSTRTLYVNQSNPAASDANPGTNPLLPKLTIGAAVTQINGAAVPPCGATAPTRCFVLVGDGLYPEGPVTMNAQVSILGGYQNDFQARNIALWGTRLTPAGACVGGTFPDPVETLTIGTGAGATTLIQGLRIEGCTGGTHTAGVTIQGTPAFQINYVDGGDGGSSSSGLVIANALCAGGRGAIGLNRIEGGVSATNAAGLRTSSAGAGTFCMDVFQNTIVGGTRPTGSPATISYGVFLDKPASSLAPNIAFANNVVFGGVGGNVIGFYANNTGNAFAIAHNSIAGDLFAVVTSIALSIDGASQPYLGKNILFTNSGVLQTCLQRLAAGVNPTSLQNNNLWNCGTLFDNVGVPQGLAALNATPPSYGGNLSVDPFFVNRFSDLHLSVQTPCALARDSLSIAVTLDRDTLPRTATPGTSMGAYEYDGACL
jgi:hypothetical protein